MKKITEFRNRHPVLCTSVGCFAGVSFLVISLLAGYKMIADIASDPED